MPQNPHSLPSSGDKRAYEMAIAVGDAFPTEETADAARPHDPQPGRQAQPHHDRPQARPLHPGAPGQRRHHRHRLRCHLPRRRPLPGATRSHAKPRLAVEKSDLQRKVRVRRAANLILFVVDASWSMAAAERMEATKGAIMSLLMDAYQRRDQVGLVVFQKEEARLVLPPTSSVELAKHRLADVPVGGKTPLSAGLLMAYRVLRQRDAAQSRRQCRCSSADRRRRQRLDDRSAGPGRGAPRGGHDPPRGHPLGRDQYGACGSLPTMA